MISSRNGWNCNIYADNSLILYIRGEYIQCINILLYAKYVIYKTLFCRYVYSSSEERIEGVRYTIFRNVFFRKYKHMQPFWRALKNFLWRNRYDAARASAT